MFDKKFFGKQIKKFRTLRNLTLLDLSEKAEISHEYLARIESGNHTPTLETIVKLINALNISYGTLMETDDNEKIMIEPIIRYFDLLSDDEVIFMSELLLELDK